MRIAVLGTGSVGRTLATALDVLGHQVTIGTRDVAATMARTEPDAFGNPPFPEWAADHDAIGLATFAEATDGADLIVNATGGTASLDALTAAAADGDLAGTIIVDVANPLDFSRGWPPSLAVANTDSLGERIQRSFPHARVVKTLNTMNAAVMVDPGMVAGGDHTVLLSGDDADAKATVGDLLRALGWTDIVDLGGIVTARGVEMVLPLWLSLNAALGVRAIQFKVVR
ncbi:MAG TPA: NAD(P)-binding domain-containing protein [Euzebyales bacterium]